MKRFRMRFFQKRRNRNFIPPKMNQKCCTQVDPSGSDQSIKGMYIIEVHVKWWMDGFVKLNESGQGIYRWSSKFGRPKRTVSALIIKKFILKFEILRQKQLTIRLYSSRVRYKWYHLLSINKFIKIRFSLQLNFNVDWDSLTFWTSSKCGWSRKEDNKGYGMDQYNLEKCMSSVQCSSSSLFEMIKMLDIFL